MQHLQYLPFGEHFVNERSAAYDERFTFTGKERDAETGYYYHGARFNSSDIGWLSVDPMSDKYPSMSPYAYCAWNPVKLVDPDGEWPEHGVRVLLLKASVGLGLYFGVGGSIQRGMAFDRHGLTHFSGYSVTLPHNQQIYSDNKNPTVVIGVGVSAGFEYSYFSSTNSFFDVIKQSNVSFNFSGHWGGGINFALGENSASIGGGVGMDVSIRNEGAFRITESISLSKEESENICSYKEWAVSTPTFHEDKKGKKYFEATVLTSHLGGLFEKNTGITVRSEALKNENGEYVPNGIWLSKKYKLYIEKNE